MSDEDDVMDELARAHGVGEDYSIVHDSHAVAAAIEASPVAREARQKAYEAVKARNQAAWEAAADEAAAALPFVKSGDGRARPRRAGARHAARLPSNRAGTTELAFVSGLAPALPDSYALRGSLGGTDSPGPGHHTRPRRSPPQSNSAQPKTLTCTCRAPRASGPTGGKGQAIGQAT